MKTCAVANVADPSILYPIKTVNKETLPTLCFATRTRATGLNELVKQRPDAAGSVHAEHVLEIFVCTAY